LINQFSNNSLWHLPAINRNFSNDRCVPKVASNFVTINDRYGAVAAVFETQDDFRFVPN
jgi:surface antigen